MRGCFGKVASGVHLLSEHPCPGQAGWAGAMVGPALTEVGPLYRGFMPETVINVNNFRIDYNREGKVDQFYSDLSILEGVLQGKVLPSASVPVGGCSVRVDNE